MSVGSGLPPQACVLAYLERVLGPVSVSGNHTRRIGRVTEITDVHGVRWIAKTAPQLSDFRSELHAYTHWVPHFADQAPALRDADPRLRTLILTRLPGCTDWTFEPEDHRQAGQLLARIHGSKAPRHDGPTLAETTHDKLERVLASAPAPRPFTDLDLEIAFTNVHALGKLSHLDRVPCHGDYGGHNWLRGGNRMAVIDFASAGWNAAAADFARLFIGPWWERPDLATAFFSGYGRPITAEELEAVRLQLPVLALGLICHGRRHGDPEMERRGRHRLNRLMASRDFTRRAPWIRRQAGRLRSWAHTHVDRAHGRRES